MTKMIKIKDCSIRISAVATQYGFKTLSSFHKFLKQCNPSAKLYFGMSHVRVATMLMYVDKEYNCLKIENAIEVAA